MLKNVFKVLVGVSMLSVVIIGGATFVEASTKSENVIVNDEIEMTAEEYFDTWKKQKKSRTNVVYYRDDRDWFVVSFWYHHATVYSLGGSNSFCGNFFVD